METFWIRAVSQLGVYAIFGLYLLWAVRRGRRAWVPYLGMVGYAVLFEHLNMLRYAGQPGGYHYHPTSWLFLIGDVPLYIPLAWAFIVATSVSLTDRLNLRPWARPFSDALLALLIDLSMDAVAIRLKFWFWHDVGLNDAFFGVPADNFLGWLLVTFTYSALTRGYWSLAVAQTPRRPAAPFAIQWVLIPLAAYSAYLGLEAVVHGAYRLFHADTQREQLIVLVGLLGLFLTVGLYGRQRNRPKPIPARSSIPRPWPLTEASLEALIQHGPRQAFHLFAVIGLVCLPPAESAAGLWILAAAVWSIESVISRKLPAIEES